MFAAMLEGIKEETVGHLFNVRVQPAAPAEPAAGAAVPNTAPTTAPGCGTGRVRDRTAGLRKATPAAARATEFRGHHHRAARDPRPPTRRRGQRAAGRVPGNPPGRSELQRPGRGRQRRAVPGPRPARRVTAAAATPPSPAPRSPRATGRAPAAPAASTSSATVRRPRRAPEPGRGGAQPRRRAVQRQPVRPRSKRAASARARPSISQVAATSATPWRGRQSRSRENRADVRGRRRWVATCQYRSTAGEAAGAGCGRPGGCRRTPRGRAGAVGRRRHGRRCARLATPRVRARGAGRGRSTPVARRQWRATVRASQQDRASGWPAGRRPDPPDRGQRGPDRPAATDPPVRDRARIASGRGRGARGRRPSRPRRGWSRGR